LFYLHDLVKTCDRIRIKVPVSPPPAKTPQGAPHPNLPGMASVAPSADGGAPPSDPKRAADDNDGPDGKRPKYGGYGDKVPITLLSGFLGAGKTTVLRHILMNKEGLKVGIIVNDVAEINIDAKLIRNEDKGGTNADYAVGKSDMIELQNGCVCCSASDELFTNLGTLVNNCRNQETGRPNYDHIVIECTGVAEPKIIRDKFQEAALDALPVLQEVQLHTLVTLVDSSEFLDQWESKQCLDERPDLGADEYDEGGGERQLVDLLVEQIECADVLVLNKADQISAEQLVVLEEICQGPYLG
jgi:G3E family GTPase